MRSLVLLAALAVGLSLTPGPRRASVPFDRHELLGDAAFRDSAAMDERDVQLFLEHTPYGRPSVLAMMRAGDGRPAARVVVDEARRAGLNPLVLLAKLQVEQSLVSRASASPGAIAYALGCNCPEGGRCDTSTRGFTAQVRCAADKLAAYFEEHSRRGATRSLWRVGAPRRAACGETVAPRNRASAALYTYTPYVLTGRGGNWLFHQIFRRYAHYAGYYPETIASY